MRSCIVLLGFLVVACAGDLDGEPGDLDEGPGPTENEEPSGPGPAQPLRVSGTNGGLNLRGGPGPNYDRIAIIPEGCLVLPTGPPTDNFFLPVTWEGLDGWVNAFYVEKAEPGSPDCM